MPDVRLLRNTIHEILKHIRDAAQGVANTYGNIFDSGNPKLRVISSLAEGADQWIADEACDLGYDLHCPLPFPREEYEKDFEDPTAKALYLNLLGKALAVLELDGQVGTDDQGKRKPSGAAYEAVGRAVLNQTDLLIAIWDGKPEQGRGGTATVITEALQRGIPVVWVTWADPKQWSLRLLEWQLLKHPADIEGDADRLKAQVQQLLLPPAETDSSEHGRETTKREQYFHETQTSGNIIHGLWPVFNGVLTGEIFRRKNLKALLNRDPFRVKPFEATTREQWDMECKGTLLERDQTDKEVATFAVNVDDSYFQHYAWANGLSGYYASLYRSAFVVAYLLAALAVFLALFAPAIRLEETGTDVFVGLELVAILIILAITALGRHERWHERSIDYRMLAERLRLARCLALFGSGGQHVSLAAPHLATYGNPVATWMHWHYQAVERAAGLANVRFTPDYLAACQEFWRKNLIEDQIKYHRAASTRYQKLDRHVHVLGIGLFAATLVACALHLFHIAKPFAGWLTLAAAFLPALGAALAAIRTQAEAQRLSRRSHGMMQSLEQLGLEFASIPTNEGEGNSQRLRARADKITDLMIKEMLDWRVVLLDQPLETHI